MTEPGQITIFIIKKGQKMKKGSHRKPLFVRRIIHPEQDELEPLNYPTPLAQQQS